MPDPKHPGTKQRGARKQQGSHDSGSQSGRKAQEGAKKNPGNLANDPDRVRKAGENGGRSHF
jgi:general stress protein YciG